MLKRFLVAICTVTTVFLATAALASAGLTVNYVFNGHGGYSADGLGQNGVGGTVDAEVPAGSTVERAYLYGTYFTSDPSEADRTINFDGTTYVLAKISEVNYLSTARADVTAQVAAKVGPGGGRTPFQILSDPFYLDGVALVVVYSNREG